MIGISHKKDEVIEEFINDVRNIFESHGLKTKRFSETARMSCTDYDILILKDKDGKEYKISFDESMTMDKNHYGRWISTDYIKEE